MEKAGDSGGFLNTPCADTPKHAPADDRLFLDTPGFFWWSITVEI
jgi:hypothetical protein